MLSLQILISSLRSPTTTNAVQEPFELKAIHIETVGTGHGVHNVCSALMGAQAGCALHSWLCKHISWLTCIIAVGMITCTIVDKLAPNSVSLIIDACLLTVPVLVGLCQRVSALKQLACTVSTWYYVLFISAGRILNTWIYGPRFWKVSIASAAQTTCRFVCKGERRGGCCESWRSLRSGILYGSFSNHSLARHGCCSTQTDAAARPCRVLCLHCAFQERLF